MDQQPFERAGLQPDHPGGQFGAEERLWPPGDHGPMPPRRRPVGHPVIAWIFIALFCSGAIALNFIEEEPPAKNLPSVPGRDSDDPLGVMLMELQAKYMVGAADLNPAQSALVYSSTETALNVGSIGQRLRFVILAAELMGPEEAALKLNELVDDIREEQGRNPDFKLTAEQLAVQRILFQLYDPQGVSEPENRDGADGESRASEEPAPDAPVVVDQADRDLLIRELGWFGKLALAPRGTADTVVRDEVMRPARWTVRILLGVAIGGIAAGIAGFGGLIAMTAMIFMRRIVSRMGTGIGHHGIYAETFAIWMLLLVVLQIGAGKASAAAPQLGLGLTLIAFFASLIALAWPVLRGLRWADVRSDIGWTLGRHPVLEPLFGVAGYFMALPLLGIGVLITLLLLFIQGLIAGEPSAFAPAGGPAHPIIMELGGPDLWPKIVILFLAAVAAPIVEETMFRGVLYRHLRDATAKLGMVLSIFASGTINAFVFAAIHPQGWVAIPALMSLAYAFVLIREWRGTVIPAMIIHGISNGIVMTMLIVALGA